MTTQRELTTMPRSFHASRHSRIFAHLVILSGLGILLSGCGGPVHVSSNPQLTRITVAPDGSTLAVGQTLQFTVSGTYSDGTSKDQTSQVLWTSSNPSVGSVSSTGLVHATGVGLVSISASINGLTASTNVKVNRAAPQSIAITPSPLVLAVGQKAQVTATATLTDGSSQDVTQTATWSISDPSVIQIDANGLASALKAGTSTFSATLNSLVASSSVKVNSAVRQSIAITPSPVLLIVGQKAQVTATVTLTDGSSQDVTHTVTWSISDPSVIQINSNGVASALKAGTSTFTASLGGPGQATISGNGTAKVTPELLQTLQISAHDASMPLGTSQRLTATGTFNDGVVRDLTSTVSWSSSPSSVVSVSATGEATAVARGSATLSATANGINASMTLNVGDPVMSSIAIEPSNLSILVGRSVQLKAIATFSDGSTSDLTSTAAWTVDDPRILEINQTGNAIAFSPGTAAIEASQNGFTGKANVVVRPVALVSYFSGASSKTDTTVRMVGTSRIDAEICTMVYVFNQDQQMSECCGCQVSREGLRTLSLQHDLVSNPLTGITPKTGTVVLVTSASNANTSCNPAVITPAGFGDAWATHMQSTDPTLSATETQFTKTELSDTLLTNLQSQCSYIQMLGSGQGVCSCGTGD